ncbi:MAG: adenosylcobinamide-GDP ribazoletransferase, partial [Alphaproteobacteria bacterium]|nr:adenosylcobinamide-GDP ribazoletransferase [Alphaproteobacteria bacterium]
RAFMGVIMWGFDTAGKTGMAATAGKPCVATVMIAMVLAIMPAIILYTPSQYVIGLIIPLLAGLGFSLIMRSKLGGYNGDSLGAACQVVEIATYLTLMGLGGSQIASNIDNLGKLIQGIL